MGLSWALCVYVTVVQLSLGGGAPSGSRGYLRLLGLLLESFSSYRVAWSSLNEGLCLV